MNRPAKAECNYPLRSCLTFASSMDASNSVPVGIGSISPPPISIAPFVSNVLPSDVFQNDIVLFFFLIGCCCDGMLRKQRVFAFR